MGDKHILLPINLRNSSFDTLLFAQKLARQSSARITLLNVVDLNIAAAPNVYDDVCQENKNALRRLGKLFFGDAANVNVCVKIGRPHEQILETAQAEFCNLIVLSSPKPSVWRRLLDLGTVKAIVRAAPCPTLVLPRLWKMPPSQNRDVFPLVRTHTAFWMPAAT
ncbi:MAG TPA: universal stress protein [Verrucomicrobiae bacterium]|jgi:nucleotide-binding universal stress UspA family protein